MLIIKLLREISIFFILFKKSIHYHFQERVRSLIKDHFYEKKLGIETSEKFIYEDNISLFRDGRNYDALPYYHLEKLIDYLSPLKTDICIDIGCGKGRVVIFFAMQKIRKVIGIELLKEMAEVAKKNLYKVRQKGKINTQVEIINADAARFNYEHGTIFILCNPFGYKTFETVVNNIKTSLEINPRKIRIVYYLPKYKKILDNQDWLEFESMIEKTSIYIWTNLSEKK